MSEEKKENIEVSEIEIHRPAGKIGIELWYRKEAGGKEISFSVYIESNISSEDMGVLVDFLKQFRKNVEEEVRQSAIQFGEKLAEYKLLHTLNNIEMINHHTEELGNTVSIKRKDYAKLFMGERW